MGETDQFYIYNPVRAFISMQKGFLENLVGGDHPTRYEH